MKLHSLETALDKYLVYVQNIHVFQHLETTPWKQHFYLTQNHASIHMEASQNPRLFEFKTGLPAFFVVAFM